MNRRPVLFAIVLLAAAAASSQAATSEDTFGRNLSLNGNPVLNVTTGSGTIHVSPGPDTQIHITGHVRANAGWLSGDVDARLKQIVAAPPIVQAGNVVTIGPSHADSGLLRDLFRNISIDYDILTPRSTTVKARSGSGSVEISGIDGTVDAEAGSGNVHATGIRGASSLETGSGNIDLSLAGPGDVRATTGSGSIRIEGLAGSLRATVGSGSINVTGNPTSEWRLTTGSGSIHLQIPPSARFNLNAETGSGGVHLDRPIATQGNLNRRHVAGTVNGGGPALRASTGSGSITID
jgi:DUF4097 and DUF4098 domain-containing protein YvlB